MSRRSSAAPSPVRSVGANGPPKSLTPAQDKQMLLLGSESGHFSLVRALHMADYVTVLNGFCGVMSIFSSLQYCLGEPTRLCSLWSALAFMPFALFFDFMDGKIARWRRKSSLMGQELDSLADLISFGVAPAVVGFAVGLRSIIDRLALTFFVLCGLVRLARFNVTAAVLPKDKSGKSKFFEGTPIPTTLVIAGVVAYWISRESILEDLPFGIIAAGTPVEFHPVIGFYLLSACLMVSKTLHVPKP